MRYSTHGNWRLSRTFWVVLLALMASPVLAESFSSFNPPVNNIASYAALLPLAQAGDAGAQNIIGFMHFKGVGVEQNFEVAHEWFHQAAEGGSVVAKRNLGLFHSGTLPRLPQEYQDLQEANEWLDLVASNDSGPTANLDAQSSMTGDAWHPAPKSTRLLDSGRATYLSYCAGCHGSDGIAAIKLVPSFAYGERQEKDQASLIDSVTHGVGAMPAWQGRLDKKAIEDVVCFIREYFGDPSRVERAVLRRDAGVPVEASAELRRGEQLYQTFCVGCHGVNGVARYVISPSFLFGERADKADQELIRSINQGKGAMPGWENMLSPTDISALVVYIKSLSGDFQGRIDHEGWRPSPEFYYKFRPPGDDGDEWFDPKLWGL